MATSSSVSVAVNIGKIEAVPVELFPFFKYINFKLSFEEGNLPPLPRESFRVELCSLEKGKYIFPVVIKYTILLYKNPVIKMHWIRCFYNYVTSFYHAKGFARERVNQVLLKHLKDILYIYLFLLHLFL